MQVCNKVRNVHRKLSTLWRSRVRRQGLVDSRLSGDVTLGKWETKKSFLRISFIETRRFKWSTWLIVALKVECCEKVNQDGNESLAEISSHRLTPPTNNTWRGGTTNAIQDANARFSCVPLILVNSFLHLPHLSTQPSVKRLMIYFEKSVLTRTAARGDSAPTGWGGGLLWKGAAGVQSWLQKVVVQCPLLWSWKEVVQCPIMFCPMCPVCPASGESAPPDIFPTINCSQRAFFFNALRHFCYNVSPCRLKKPLCLCKTNYTRSPARARELYSIRASLWL